MNKEPHINLHHERIYFMQAGQLVKIGTTTGDIRARAAQIQTGCPHKIFLLGWIGGGHEREAKLHKQFAHLRVQGEWFFASCDLLACIEALKDSQDYTDKCLLIEDVIRTKQELEAAKEFTELLEEHNEALQDLAEIYQAVNEMETAL